MKSAMGGPDYIVDIAGVRARSPGETDPPASLQGRPWIAVEWACCGVYGRVYRNRSGDAYEARCPKCQRPVRVRIGPGGTDHRFFRAE